MKCKKRMIFNAIAIFIITSSLISCLGFGEPKVIIAYRFYNDSNDTIELIGDQGIEISEITDSLIYNYSKPLYTFTDTVKNQKHKDYINPHSFEDVQSIEYWRTVIKEYKLNIVVLNKDSVNSIKNFKKGLVSKCILKIIPLIHDSLEGNDYVIHYKK